MKIPVTPPDDDALMEKIFASSVSNERIRQLFKSGKPVDSKGRYLHWDKLRHLEPPNDLTSEHWWFSIKSARRLLYNQLPFVDKYGKPMQYAVIDSIQREFHWLDRYCPRSR